LGFSLPSPARSQDFVLYLQYIGEKKTSKSAAEEVCNALAWAHSISGLTLPSTHPLVKTTLEGLQHLLAKPVVKSSALRYISI